MLPPGVGGTHYCHTMAGLVLSPFAAQQRILPFMNKSGERVPPHAVVKLKRSRAGKSHHGYKPDKDDDPFVVFNGQFEVEPDGDGYATVDYPLWARYNAADGDPTNGESLGTRAGFWELHRGYEGFLVWGGADGEKVYVQSDVTCRESGGDQYYYSSYYGGYGPNPRYVINCCGATTNLSSVLIMNHGGSLTHDRGMTLRRWNGGYDNPVPWHPRYLTEFLIGGSPPPFTVAAWYSDFIEFMTSGPVTLTLTVDSGTEVSDFTWEIVDTWWVYYSAFAYAQCFGTFNQVFRRTGTVTRVTFNRSTGITTTDVFDQTFPADVSGSPRYWSAAPSAGGQEAPFSAGVQACFALTAVAECNPFYAKGYLGQPYNGEYSGIFATVPEYAAVPGIGPLFQWVDGSYDIEPNQYCSGNFSSDPVHAPYLEVMDAAGTPYDFPWTPP
jgi:hypothetical protein